MNDLLTLLVRRGARCREEVIAGRPQLRIDIARDIVERQIFADVGAELGRVLLGIEVIVDARLSRRQQLEWSHRHRAGMEVIDVELIIVVGSRSAEAGTLIEGAETAAFRSEAPCGRSFAFLADDRDYAA